MLANIPKETQGGIFKFHEGIVVSTIDHFAFEKSPQAFDQVEGSGSKAAKNVSEYGIPRLPDRLAPIWNW